MSAFVDAVLAIILTILVLELERPDSDSLAQVVYGLVVLFIIVSNRVLYRSLYQDDPNNLLLKQRIEDMKKWRFFDTVGKVVGLVLSATIFLPAMLLSVLLTLVVLVIPRQLKED
ncbi:TPA: DUF1211 domain-containing protein [Streptococcus suis]|nr:DUF1211 domain-containing protein [Streptococcus suis]